MADEVEEEPIEAPPSQGRHKKMMTFKNKAQALSVTFDREKPQVLNRAVSFSSIVYMRGNNFPFMKRVVNSGSIATFASNHCISTVLMKN